MMKVGPHIEQEGVDKEEEDVDVRSRSQGHGRGRGRGIWIGRCGGRGRGHRHGQRQIDLPRSAVAIRVTGMKHLCRRTIPTSNVA